jgi:hypothetical protein
MYDLFSLLCTQNELEGLKKPYYPPEFDRQFYPTNNAYLVKLFQLQVIQWCSVRCKKSGKIYMDVEGNSCNLF